LADGLRHGCRHAFTGALRQLVSQTMCLVDRDIETGAHIRAERMAAP
jgi:hypothetical protein